MRRLFASSALVLVVAGLVGCGDTDESVQIDEPAGTTDDSTPVDEPDVSPPPDDGDEDDGPDDPISAGEVDDLLAATEQANSGTFELVDGITGTGTASGEFQQEPVAFSVDYADDPTLPGTFLVVDDTAYSQDADGGPWTELGEAGLSEDVIIDIGPLPDRILKALTTIGAPEVLDAETGGSIYRWTATSAEVGLSEGTDAAATVDVQADDDGRVHTVTITQQAAGDPAAGGTFTITFEYDESAPPITAPPNPTILGGEA